MGLYASLATARVSWRRVLEILDAPVGGRRARAMPGLCQARAGRSPSTPCRSAPSEASRCSMRSASRRNPAQSSPSSARAASASPRSRFWRRGCSIRTAAPFDSTATICARCRLADVRRHIVLVEQEPTLLHATIGENIRYVRPEATEDRCGRRPKPPALRAFVERAARGVSTPWSVSEAWHYRQESVSASPSRARFLPTLACSSSTNRPRRSMRRPNGTSLTAIAGDGGRPHHDADHPSPRTGDGGRSRRRARERPRRRSRAAV